jgi:fructose-bisphosphate aldolase, class II
VEAKTLFALKSEFYNMKREKKFEFLKKARKEGWAIGQFNASTLEALKAIFFAAKNLKSPIIIGTSEKESGYLGLRQAAALVRIFEEENGVPALLNLDHGKSFDYIKEAIAAGYDAVHFDGSQLPLDENVRILKEIVKYAHKKNVLVEGEVGFIKGASEILDAAPDIYLDDLASPSDAEKLVKETKVDSLAVNVGTFHGLGGIKTINLARLGEIKEKISEKSFLVLHGGSGILQEEIKAAISTGIVKININTELRAAFTQTLQEIFCAGQKEIAPYRYLPRVIESMQKIVEDKIKIFNSVNKI